MTLGTGEGTYNIGNTQSRIPLQLPIHFFRSQRLFRAVHLGVIKIVWDFALQLLVRMPSVSHCPPSRSKDMRATPLAS